MRSFPTHYRYVVITPDGHIFRSEDVVGKEQTRSTSPNDRSPGSHALKWTVATIYTVLSHFEGHNLHTAASNTDLKMFKLVSNQHP